MAKKLIPIKSLDEIPEHTTEAEAAEFYDTHSLAEVWVQMEPVEVEFLVRPPSSRKRLSVTLREDLIDGLKRVADRKGWRLRILLSLWLRQRLMEEEARNAIALARPRQVVTRQQMVKALETLPDQGLCVLGSRGKSVRGEPGRTMNGFPARPSTRLSPRRRAGLLQ